MILRNLITILALVLSSLFSSVEAAEAVQNRGLFAFVNGDKVQVSWRMRATDHPLTTKYELYANNSLCGTYRTNTMVLLDKSVYGNSTFKIVVKNSDGDIIDVQDGVRAKSAPYFDIALSAPSISKGGVEITYSPMDCSAYDMDGDGEQEIILKWEPSVLTTVKNSDTGVSGNEFLDCYKLNGTRLWRIDMGQNMGAGNNFPFLCWDFDGDGKGEIMVKSAPGTKDAKGNYVGSGAHSDTGVNLPGYDTDLNKTYYRGSDGLPTKGEEWITCFDGVTGEELGSKQYWPYFSIQSNWYPGGNDTYTYGRRGCGFKGAVVKIPCNDGEDRYCCCFQRGVYSYVYATAISWDGNKLVEEWRNCSEKATNKAKENDTATSSSFCSWSSRDGGTTRKYQYKSLYGEGAHPSISADIDGDGYDEVVIGAAAIDHDGSVLWSTALGHGDAVHVGELNPDNEGLEVWRITEVGSTYDACMIDGKTGKVLNGQLLTGGDVGRGLALDMDPKHPGNEYIHNNSGMVYDCNGKALYTKDMGNNNGYPNYRIYWDGDLTDEHMSGAVVSKFMISGTTASLSRCSTPTSGTKTLWSLYSVNTINESKDNPCLQCDLLGDWREELVYFCDGGTSTVGGDFALRVVSSTFPTDYKLPWLRDDNTYNLAIACQNVGYSMPPHLGYNPVEYYAEIEASAGKKVLFTPNESKAYSISTVISTSNRYVTFTDTSVKAAASPYSLKFVATSTPGVYYIQSASNHKYLADNGTTGFKLVESISEATPYLGEAYGNGQVEFSSTTATDNKYLSMNVLQLSRKTTPLKMNVEVDTTTGVEESHAVEKAPSIVSIVKTDGSVSQKLTKGINIVRYSDGSVRKISVK